MLHQMSSSRPLAAPAGISTGRPSPVAQASLALVLVAALWIGLLPLTALPAEQPNTVPATTFSAARALQDLAVIAAEPHPTGSPAAAAVRDYLRAEIRKLGLEPEVQSAVLTVAGGDGAIASTKAVENVLVTVSGTESGPALLISGHYDSAPTTAGAGDCGVCTATVLETLRAFVAGPQPRHDVIFLFTDSEETGVAGAQAFMEQHPAAKNVGLDLVYEGLGTQGASMLYVTGPRDGWFAEQAFAAMPSPVGYSYVHDIMWRLAGNSGSDLDAFIADGAPGLGMIHLSLSQSPAYHTTSDRIASLTPGTLQQHGDNALAMVRRFADADLAAAPRQANLVYFNITPLWLARYSTGWALPLAVVCTVLWLGLAAVGLRRRTFTLGGVLAGAGAWLIGLFAAILVVTLAWWALRWADPNLHQYRVGGWYGAPFYLLAFTALVTALYSALYFGWRRRFSSASLTLGALLWWVVFALLLAQSMPGLSAAAVWPALVALTIAWIWMLKPAWWEHPWAKVAGLAAAAAVCLVMMAPVVYVLAVYALRMEALLGLPIAALPIPFIVLALGLLQPVLDFLAPRRHVWVPAMALIASLAFFLGATLQSAPSAERPIANTVVYQLDADQNTATWVTFNDSRAGRGVAGQIDAWTQQFFPHGAVETEINPWLSGWFEDLYPALQGPAPVSNQPQTVVEVVGTTIDEEGRKISLHLTPPEASLSSQVFLEAGGRFTAIAVNGETIELGPDRGSTFQLNVYGRHAKGITIDLTAPDGPVTITTQDRIMGLPAIPEFQITPRPAWMQPAPFNDIADSIIVRRKRQL